MIEYRKGNLLDVTSGVIAHGVNCQGVMGSGVAKAIREKYPKAYDQYKCYCDSNVLNESSELLGHVQFIPLSLTKVGDALILANCFTQNFYGTNKRQVNYEAVAQCFASLKEKSKLYGQLNIPKIGAGLGGGDWDVIKSIIESEYKADVIVWEL